jgi:hypothetical protein
MMSGGGIRHVYVSWEERDQDFWNLLNPGREKLKEMCPMFDIAGAIFFLFYPECVTT